VCLFNPFDPASLQGSISATFSPGLEECAGFAGIAKRSSNDPAPFRFPGTIQERHFSSRSQVQPAIAIPQDSFSLNALDILPRAGTRETESSKGSAYTDGAFSENRLAHIPSLRLASFTLPTIETTRTFRFFLKSGKSVQRLKACPDSIR
jgi:hypothetical protein